MDGEELHQKNRESLIANEGFAISMQQVVSGGMLLGALSQWAQIAPTIGRRSLVGFVFMAGVGLIAALLAAQFRHDYRMWDVKAAASLAGGNLKESGTRAERAGRFLWLMRYAMWAATLSLIVAVLVVLANV
jgi:hypothetical protein